MNDNKNNGKVRLNRGLENLLAMDPAKIESKVLAAAVEEHRKQEEKRQQALALQHIASVQRTLDEAVNSVRNARKEARKAEANLAKIDAAKDAFFKDGDYDAFVKAVNGAEIDVW